MRKLLLLIALLGLFAAQQAKAAIAEIAFSSCPGIWCVSAAGSGTAPTTSYNVTTGTLLVIDVVALETSGATPPGITAVSFNAVACTQYKLVNGAADSNAQTTATYICPSPASGAHPVSVSFTGTAVYMQYMMAEYSGVDTSNPMGGGATGNETNPNCPIAPSGGTCSLAMTVSGSSGQWLHSVVLERFGTLTGGTNTTARVNSGSASYMTADSNGVVTAGSQSANWTSGSGGTGSWPGQIVVAMCPTGGTCGAAPPAAKTAPYFRSPF